MRSRLIALSAAFLALGPAGCRAEPTPQTLPPVHVVEPPAASAGGACILWDYAFIEEMTGVRFTVAAGDRVDETSTCVVRTESAAAPLLVLAVVDQTAADAKLFTDHLMPAKATKLKGLGKAGYRLVTKASAGLGPTVEIGWLSEAQQIQSLKFTFAGGATADAVDDMSAKMLGMAKAMSTTDGGADAK